MSMSSKVMSSGWGPPEKACSEPQEDGTQCRQHQETRRDVDDCSAVEHYGARRIEDMRQREDGGKLLREGAWIPTTDHEFIMPEDLTSLDELHATLSRDTHILSLLDVAISTEHEDAAQVLGIDSDDAAWIREHKEDFEKWKQAMTTRMANRDALEAATSRKRWTSKM